MPSQSELTAILVCPTEQLAREFNDAVVRKGMVQMVEHMQEYPSAQQLETRIRQLRPAFVLVDLTNMETALPLISVASIMSPTVYAVGVHVTQDAVAIMQTLRAGGTEFLSAPFDPDSVNAALGRVHRLKEAQTAEAPIRGKVFAFTAVKPGQGVTTIASNVAAALADGGKRRVLLIDFDSLASTISFSWRVTHGYSVFDAMQNADKLDEALWSALVANRNGVDLLLGPEVPDPPPLSADRYTRVVEFSRSMYECIVLDLPTLYGPEARAVLPDCDRIHIVSTPELPSLHLSRKCLAHLESEGFSKDQFGLVINRMDKRGDLTTDDLKRIFNFPIGDVFQDDPGSIHRALTAGKPLPDSCELGKDLRKLSRALLGETATPKKKKAAAGLKLSALLSQGLS